MLTPNRRADLVALLALGLVGLLAVGLLIGWQLSLLKDAAWISFWGSVIGSVFGAVATVGAVYGAFRVAHREAREREEERRIAAHAIALLIFGELVELQVKIEDATKNVWTAVAAAGMDRNRDILDLIRVDVLPHLSGSIDRLHLVRGAGGTILQLLSIVAQYSRMLDSTAYDIEKGRIDDRVDAQNLADMLEIAQQLAKQALDEIKPIHDWSG